MEVMGNRDGGEAKHSGSRFWICTAVVLSCALAPLLAACQAQTFSIAGNYLYPAPLGATTSAVCHGEGSSQGRRLHVSVMGQHHVYEVAGVTLGAGWLDASSRVYGARPFCVYPYTVSGIPAGQLGYVAAVGTEPGTGFGQADYKNVTIWGLPPNDKQGGL